MGAYGPPVDQFLNRLEEPQFCRTWPDYLDLGIDSSHIPELIRMATDPELNEAETESREVWAPVHAWRTLGQLRAESAVDPLIEMLADLTDDSNDDWVVEELPTVLGMIGAAAIPAARGLLADESEGEYSRIAAGQVLVEIGKRHPEARDECVAVLSEVLERTRFNPPFLNGFLVSYLLDLHANEAARTIERAYASGFVDDSIAGTWHEVWHGLDLEGEPPPETERQYQLIRDDEDGWWAAPPEGPKICHSWEPAATRTPEDRKDRNKARKKLEQKIKGKKGKKP